MTIAKSSAKRKNSIITLAVVYYTINRRNRRASDNLQDAQRDRQASKASDAFPERNLTSVLIDTCWDFQPAIPRHQRRRGGQCQHRQKRVLALDWLMCTDVEQVRKRVVRHHRHVSDASDRGRLLHDGGQSSQARCCSSLCCLVGTQ